MNKNRLVIGFALGLGPIGIATLYGPALVEMGTSKTVAGLGSETNLEANYQAWMTQQKSRGLDRKEGVPIGWFKGLSTEKSDARGQITLNFEDGSVTAGIAGLSTGEAWDLWLIGNQPGDGRTVKPEVGDRLLRVGSFTPDGKTLQLAAQLDANTLNQVDPDLYVVTHAGKSPLEERVILGTSPLFERLYREEQRVSAKAGDPDAGRQLTAESLRIRLAEFLGGSAQAELGPNPQPATAFQQLVEAGRNSFFNETFNGNGRTCGTCHRENNNLTIDPKFIATLPITDPLFVAETVPALKENFEDPELMRKFGLIKENVDGFDDLAHKFVMRGVPHTLALIETSLKPASLVDNTDPAVLERLGWGGDGAPGTGTVREFILGAIVQHYPKTLGRKEGVDFRLPTLAELDALEAFQKSLGRQADLKLLGPDALRLKSAAAAAGQAIFNNPGTFPAPGTPLPEGVTGVSLLNKGAGKCFICHFNGGSGDLVESVLTTGNLDLATAVVTSNANFDTGVEDLPKPVAATRMPPDGGFGRDPLYLPDGSFLGFGSLTAGRTFNVPPLVEAADTAPFMHNNAFATVEDAIRSYASASFRNSAAGQFFGPIELSEGQVQNVGAFLRTANALENIRSAKDLTQRSAAAGDADASKTLIDLAKSEIDDAVEVLSGKALHPLAVSQLKVVKGSLVQVSVSSAGVRRNRLYEASVAGLDNARGNIAFPDGAGTTPPPGDVPPGTAVACANENQVCILPAGSIGTVWYGVGAKWFAIVGVSDRITCNNQTFGDPIFGALKSCVYVAASVNAAPAVVLTSPGANASVAQGAALTLTASVDDSDGNVVLVEFYDGATLIGTDGRVPYSVAWPVFAATGAHTLTAKAYDNFGLTAVSTGVPIIVTAGGSTSPSSGTGLLGSYFATMDLKGPIALQRTEAVNANFGNGSPTPNIPVDRFSARWTGYVEAAAAGTYQFQTVSDDGVRVWINGRVVIDNWTSHPPTQNTSAAISLAAGQRVPVIVEYFEDSAGSIIQLLWKTPSASAFAVVPAKQLYGQAPSGVVASSSGTGTGLLGQYYAGKDLSGGAVLSRVEAVSFDWGNGSPSPDLPADGFSGRWTGSIEAVEAGAYQLQTLSDDGVRVWINGQLAIENWSTHLPAVNNSPVLNLGAGQRLFITVEYFEDWGGAVLQLNWKRLSASGFSAIPSQQLFAP